jgi:hypothetical protein
MRVVEGAVVSAYTLHAFLKHSSIQEESVDATHSHKKLKSFPHFINLQRAQAIYPDRVEPAA